MVQYGYMNKPLKTALDILLVVTLLVSVFFTSLPIGLQGTSVTFLIYIIVFALITGMIMHIIDSYRNTIAHILKFTILIIILAFLLLAFVFGYRPIEFDLFITIGKIIATLFPIFYIYLTLKKNSPIERSWAPVLKNMGWLVIIAYLGILILFISQIEFIPTETLWILGIPIYVIIYGAYRLLRN